MWLVQILLLAIVLFGHLAICVALFNRLHATPKPHRRIKFLEKLIFLFVPSLPVYLIYWFYRNGSVDAFFATLPSRIELTCYAICCYLVAAWIVADWIVRKIRWGNPAQLISNHTDTIDVAEALGYKPIGPSSTTRLLARIPFNQAFHLAVNVKTISLPQLDERLDGLTITHLSDLHFTGKIEREFFEFIVDRANELESDLVAITGDIIDRPDCVEWLPETVGRLKSKLGNYYVLGNHDKRHIDPDRVREAMQKLGFIDLGSKWQATKINGANVLFAGNEVPWMGSQAELQQAKPDIDDDTFRILLSHTPDQIQWARQQQFDLMLAGHTHGGQIRLPIIGPMVAPSNYGVRYASGTFFVEPTLMHVSRGLSGQQSIRINCMPELTQIVIKVPLRGEVK